MKAQAKLLTMTPFQGPLFDLPGASSALYKWCAMHVINLGVVLWVVGSCFKLLLTDFPGVFGEGDDSQRLRKAHEAFKLWCHHRKILTLFAVYWIPSLFQIGP